ncbi:ciliary microtubule inner protein 2B [Lepus europaeus]|uniref:ciliary microtubule inner protein 2B n=1 Tax=Lepus europaeus TaxID=9983 RepID=UPI002B465F64|nr:ciliary microtubule inner protein 2B [Lepus europaeus]
MAGTGTFIPGLHPQNPRYIPGYTGHCPLLRFSMGQTYGQVTGQLLRGPPGLAWPPARRSLLPPIRPPRSPEVPTGSLPPRRGPGRLSSSMVPGYTGFVPQAQFIFAKNCSRVWAEALNDFTRWNGGQGGPELPQGARGAKGTEKDQEPETEPEPEQEVEQVRPRRLGGTLRLPPTPWMTETLRSSSCQALQEFGQKYSRGRAQKDPKPLGRLPRTALPCHWPHLTGSSGHTGSKFQFGHTVGHLSHDALGYSTVRKQLLAEGAGPQGLPSLLILPQPSFWKDERRGLRGRDHKERMVWRLSTFFINRCNK